MAEIDIFLVVYFIKFSVIIIDFIIGSLMVIESLKLESNQAKIYFKGAYLFFFTHGICRIFFFLRTYYFPSLEFRALFYIGTLLGLLSLVFVIYAIETVIYTKTKHVFTLFGLIGVFLMILFTIFDGDYMRLPYIVWVQYIFVPPLAIVIVLIYFTHIFKSTEKIRIHFLMMTVAIVCIALGEMGNTTTARELLPWTLWGAPVLMLLGLILIYISVSRFYRKSDLRS